MEYGNYFKEAFQKLSLLEQDFPIDADKDKTDELAAFIADDREAVPEEPVFDTAAENEDELQDNYVGKVIIECECCHSKFYKEPDDVIIDEETELANVDEECPFCNATMGYTIIGKIEPFDEKEPTEDEVEIDDIEVEDEEPIEEPEEEVKESLQDRARRQSLGEACKTDESCKVDEECTGEDCIEEGCEKDESLTEGFNEVEIKTDDQKLEMTSDENGKVTVTTEPINEGEEDFNSDWMERDSMGNGELLDEPDETPEQEEIVPLTGEEAAEIEANSEEEAEEEEIPEEEEDEFTEFGEEEFENVGESYVRRVYENVKSFKTTGHREEGDTLIVEGLITFNSGNTKKTTFTFTNPRMLKGGKVVLEGYNRTFTKTKKAFSLKGRVEDKKFITESLGYHYIAKKLNESVRVNGRVKRVLV